jgi:UDP-N-acetylmuramate--alanine ligase
MNLSRIQHIYFLGIGGIGMSALARYFHDRGVDVSGYDRTPSPITRALQEEGIQVRFDQDPGQIPADTRLVVYTPAIPQGSPLMEAARERQLPMMKRSEVLGGITRDLPCIAVAGTHGKTTVCAMLAHILKTAGIPAEALMGGIAVNYNSNYLGAKDPLWIIAEADEFDRSFLHLQPLLATITSMDADHLDIYGTRDRLRESFGLFAGRVREGGKLLLRKGLELPEGRRGEILTYALEEGADYMAGAIRVEDGRYVADFRGRLDLPGLLLGVPGRHNVENALAAAALAAQAGAAPEAIRQALGTFLGVRRRFETCYKDAATVYIDDYAHHPGELRACIETARELYPGWSVTGIFQPHLYSRTRDLAWEFADSLAMLDELLLMDIYPAREEPIPGVNSRMLLGRVPLGNKHLVDMDQLMQRLEAKRPAVLLTMGAGDIDRLREPIVRLLMETGRAGMKATAASGDRRADTGNSKNGGNDNRAEG